MTRGAGLYRRLVNLYPAEFRREFRADLEQYFVDLHADRGACAVWARTALDLIITVPRYRLESVMSERSTSVSLIVAPAVAASIGALSVISGVVPIAGLAFLVLAALFLVVRSSNLVRALRVPSAHKNLRKQRLTIAMVLGGVFIGSLVVYMIALSDERIDGGTLIGVNAIGVPAMFGTIVFLIAGLLTPKAETARD
ncbi:hypothetical protein BH10ACT2_BH10ACT2_26920 [soil metagenome]